MKKIYCLAAFFLSLTVLCACNTDNGGSADGSSDPFGFKGNTVKPEVVIDGYDDDELWQSDNVTHTSYSTCEVSILRRPNAIYMFYKIKDITPYSFVGQGDADEVTHSDSVEFYFDTKLSRAPSPQAYCYQVNLGRDSRTRILLGSNGVWHTWSAMYTFEVREGYNDEEDYYFIEAMIPVAQMGIGASEDIGVAFGHVDRTVEDNHDLDSYYTWTGMTYKNTFIDPQAPSAYLVLRSSGGNLLTYSEYMAAKG